MKNLLLCFIGIIALSTANAELPPPNPNPTPTPIPTPMDPELQSCITDQEVVVKNLYGDIIASYTCWDVCGHNTPMPPPPYINLNWAQVEAQLRTSCKTRVTELCEACPNCFDN